VKSYQRLVDTDPGFEVSDLTMMNVALPDSYRGDPDACRSFFADLFGRLETLPGMEVVAAVEQIPFLSGLSTPPVIVETARAPEKAAIHVSHVSPTYFRTMGIALLSGRTFEAPDDAEGPQVMVVNRALAERYWPGEDSLGRRINIGTEEAPVWLSVVGVVGNVRYGARSEPIPELYRSIEQVPQWNLSVLMKSELDAGDLAGPAADAVAALDGDIPVTVRDLEESIARSAGFAGPRFGAFAISSLAGVASLLSVLGIYGVLAFTVVRRTQEIGIRMALGARRGTVLLAVLGRGSVLVAVGLLLGVVVALFFGRLLDSALYGIAATDPWTLFQVATTIALSGLAASLVPAKRATAVDPVRALRGD
jgi:putative ABC transport system permease protein